MKNIFIYSMVSFSLILLEGCGTTNVQKMSTPKFIEIVVQNHLILHGFDQDNKEIIEEVEVKSPMKKLIRVDRIQSVSEKYILTSYGFDRLVYWEYEGSYTEMKELVMIDNDK